MPDSPDARRTVSADDIARLAVLLDRFLYADDPISANCQEAKTQFNVAVQSLYENCVKPHYESLSLYQFRDFIVLKCKQHLNRERNEPPRV